MRLHNPSGTPNLTAGNTHLFICTALGFALLRFWIVYAKKTVAFTYASNLFSTPLLSTVALVAGAIAALAIATCRLRHSILRPLACLFCALALALVGTLHQWPSDILTAAALAAIGITQGIAYVLLGFAFIRLGTQAIGAMSVAVLVASTLFALGALLGDALRLALVYAIPVLCIVALYEAGGALAPKSAPQQSAAAPVTGHPHALACLLVALCANNFVIRILDSATFAQGHSGLGTVLCFAAQILVGALILIVSTRSSRPLEHLGFAYRCVLPVMAVGFLCLAVPQQAFTTVALPLIYLSHELFEIVFWTSLVALASVAKRPPRVLGVGVATVLVSMAAGSTTGNVLFGNGQHTPESTLTFIAFACVVGLLIVTIAVLPENLVLAILRAPQADTSQQPPVPASLASLAVTCGLTPRETQVFELLASGQPINAVMDALAISRGTANTHVANIYKKLGVHSQQELLAMAAPSSSKNTPS